MTFYVDPKTLLDALKFVGMTIQQRGEPLYRNVQLQVEGDTLIISATDYELVAIKTLPIFITSSIEQTPISSLLVNHNDFFLRLGALETSVTIKVTFKSDGLHINTNDEDVIFVAVYQKKVKKQVAEFYPDFPAKFKSDSEKQYTVPVSDLLHSLKKVIHAKCNDETRQNLMWIVIENDTIWATDGSRLVVAPFPWLFSSRLYFSSRVCEDLIEFLGDSTENKVNIQKIDDFVMFYDTSSKLAARSVSSMPPPCIQKQLNAVEANNCVIQTPKKSILKSLTLALAHVDLKTNPNGVIKLFLANDCNAHFELLDKPHVKSSIQDLYWPYPDIEIKCSGKHVYDFLTTSKTKHITIKINPNARFRFQLAELDRDGFETRCELFTIIPDN